MYDVSKDTMKSFLDRAYQNDELRTFLSAQNPWIEIEVSEFSEEGKKDLLDRAEKVGLTYYGTEKRYISCEFMIFTTDNL